jgi:hypothetical protein
MDIDMFDLLNIIRLCYVILRELILASPFKSAQETEIFINPCLRWLLTPLVVLHLPNRWLLHEAPCEDKSEHKRSHGDHHDYDDCQGFLQD